jgi:hypothetical protein
MAVKTRDQARYLGGRPPYAYRLADAGTHPNKARRAHGRGGAECKKCKCAEPLTAAANVSNFTIKTKTCTKA